MSHDDITPEAKSEIFEAMVRAEEEILNKWKATGPAMALRFLRLLWIWGLSKNAELTLEEDYEAASRLLGLSDAGTGLDPALGADRPSHVKRGHLEGDGEPLMVSKEAHRAGEEVAKLTVRLAALQVVNSTLREANRSLEVALFAKKIECSGVSAQNVEINETIASVRAANDQKAARLAETGRRVRELQETLNALAADMGADRGFGGLRDVTAMVNKIQILVEPAPRNYSPSEGSGVPVDGRQE